MDDIKDMRFQIILMLGKIVSTTVSIDPCDNGYDYEQVQPHILTMSKVKESLFQKMKQFILKI